MSTPGFCDWKFSATSDVIGSTVDEPEMFSEPVIARRTRSAASSSLPPQAAATSMSASAPTTMPVCPHHPHLRLLLFDVIRADAREAGCPPEGPKVNGT